MFCSSIFWKAAIKYGDFLKTCEYNKNFNWLLFTDDKTKYQYPDNVLNVQCTFE